MAETKSCPFCAEEIRSEAIRCRYCRSRLTTFGVEGWHRSHPDRKLAGVASAVGHAFAIPVPLVRLGFVIATFFHLLGPIAYLALWLVIPGQTGKTSLLERLLEEALHAIGSLAGRRNGFDRPSPPAAPQG